MHFYNPITPTNLNPKQLTICVYQQTDGCVANTNKFLNMQNWTVRATVTTLHRVNFRNGHWILKGTSQIVIDLVIWSQLHVISQLACLMNPAIIGPLNLLKTRWSACLIYCHNQAIKYKMLPLPCACISKPLHRLLTIQKGRCLTQICTT